MIFHLLISFCRCIAIINSNILTPSFSDFLLNTPTAENKKSSAVGIISIVLDSSNFHAILLPLFILYTLRQGTHQTAIAFIASLGFHHREDLPRPPSLVTTVLSRSTFDWTEVSLSPLPVIAVIEFAFQCLNLEVLYRSSLMWLVRSEQQKESI